MLFQFNFFNSTDFVAVTAKPVLSGYGVFGVMAAISTSFNFKTMSTDSKPCQGSAAFKNSTVKMVLKYKVCFNIAVKFELGGLVNDAEQFCDEGCAEVLKYIYGGNFGLTFGKNFSCFVDIMIPV